MTNITKGVLLVLLAAPVAAHAAGTGFSFTDWHIRTSQADFNWQSGQFSAPNHVTLTRPGDTIDADRANGNEKTRQAVLRGHVTLHDNNGTLTGFAAGSLKGSAATLVCDRLDIDGQKKEYVAVGHVVFTQAQYVLHADRAVMDGVSHALHLYGHVHLQS